MIVGVLINPGTEGRGGASLPNAEAVAGRICADLGISRSVIVRNPKRDRAADGYFAFLVVPDNGSAFDLDIPGDGLWQVCAGRPLKSRRLYVDGSSWLYHYALNAIKKRIFKED